MNIVTVLYSYWTGSEQQVCNNIILLMIRLTAAGWLAAAITVYIIVVYDR